MTPPTAFCRARPTTIEPTPRAVKRPETSVSQTSPSSRVPAMTMMSSRARSIRMVGMRSRLVPDFAVVKTTKFRALSSTRMTRKAKRVAASFGPAWRASHSPVWVSSSHSAPTGAT